MSGVLLEYSSESAWLEALAAEFRLAVEEAAGRGRGSCHMSLSGGSTPAPLYRLLASDPRFAELCASCRLHLWVGDERDVPEDSPQRNGRMIAESFAPAIEGRAAWTVPPMLHLWPAGDRLQACSRYADSLAAELGPEPEFDLALLGMGEDGHTAGLFSAADCQPGFGYERYARPTAAPSEPRSRMTMSAELLRRSRRLLVAVKGQSKAARLKDALEPSSSLPVAIVAGNGRFHYVGRI